ncbi:hypothetical protein D7X74_22135 [Corallococcus sp. CA047B]|uniref:hypothetical protein n=1 Tax=Corallococcus sp. CA047B TaxID=2316729 RepID=UPI000EA33047|nr:hypothetical protein [Corallococcus sp. CA047B]RKH13281.1 hypothetical protein D7X74_22135 [Corallococcus sp. CA047B]
MGYDDGDATEGLFIREPALREVAKALPGLSFVGIQEAVGVDITPLFAHGGVRGLFEIPVSTTEARFQYEPEAFLDWVRSCFRDFDFSKGVCFWFSGEPHGIRGDYWIEARLSGVEDLLPLWSALGASSVLVSSEARKCIVGIFMGEMGWEMFRQP